MAGCAYAVARELHAETPTTSGDHSGRTLVREADLRVVILALAPGAKLAEHHVKDTATVQLLAGQIRVGMPAGPIELTAGQLLPLERGIVHDVEAIEASTVLLTLALLPAPQSQ